MLHRVQLQALASEFVGWSLCLIGSFELQPWVPHMASPAPAADSVPSFELLPTDILNLIFPYLPARPLLMVIALVCRKWAAAVPLALRNFPSGSVVTKGVLRNPSLLRRAVNVSEWVVMDEVDEVAMDSILEFGTRIRTLNISRYPPRADNAVFLFLTSITSLSLGPIGLGASISNQMLRNNAATLTALSVISPFYVHKSTTLSERLPLLRSLTMACVSRDFSQESFWPFLSSHLSALTSLTIRGDAAFIQSMYSHSAPQLRTLRISTTVVASPSLSRWIAGMSSLTSLSLNVKGSISEVVRGSAHVLSHLELHSQPSYDGEHGDVLCNALDSCPKLQSFTFQESDNISPELRVLACEVWSRLGPRLKELSIPHLPMNLASVRLCCTAVERLVYAGPYFRESLSWHLPRLTSLVCLQMASSTGCDIGTLERILEQWPTLVELSVSLVNWRPEDNERLYYVLHTAERRALRVLDVGSLKSDVCDERALAATMRARLGWLELRSTKVIKQVH